MDGKIYNCEVLQVFTNEPVWGKKLYKNIPVPAVGDIIQAKSGNDPMGFYISWNLLDEPWVLSQWSPENTEQAAFLGVDFPYFDVKGRPVKSILWQLVLKVVE